MQRLIGTWYFDFESAIPLMQRQGRLSPEQTREFRSSLKDKDRSMNFAREPIFTVDGSLRVKMRGMRESRSLQVENYRIEVGGYTVYCAEGTFYVGGKEIPLLPISKRPPR
ncbi:hypothetical protein ACS5PN_17190 [Roseateles sp. NT4]|uniref:hypothetical protein n=1 Tax=Roseateles sp. NT4 TaxID=3453715 RepID=UPI003EEAB0CF